MRYGGREGRQHRRGTETGIRVRYPLRRSQRQERYQGRRIVPIVGGGRQGSPHRGRRRWTRQTIRIELEGGTGRGRQQESKVLWCVN